MFKLDFGSAHVKIIFFIYSYVLSGYAVRFRGEILDSLFMVQRGLSVIKRSPIVANNGLSIVKAEQAAIMVGLKYVDESLEHVKSIIIGQPSFHVVLSAIIPISSSSRYAVDIAPNFAA
jgi:hypothetical protein